MKNIIPGAISGLIVALFFVIPDRAFTSISDFFSIRGVFIFFVIISCVIFYFYKFTLLKTSKYKKEKKFKLTQKRKRKLRNLEFIKISILEEFINKNTTNLLFDASVPAVRDLILLGFLEHTGVSTHDGNTFLMINDEVRAYLECHLDLIGHKKKSIKLSQITSKSS